MKHCGTLLVEELNCRSVSVFNSIIKMYCFIFLDDLSKHLATRF